MERGRHCISFSLWLDDHFRIVSVRSYRRSDFAFDLPRELIAGQPLPERAASRLLVLEQDRYRHLRFTAIRELLQPNDLLVVNDTKVIKARLFAMKDTGGNVELLIERIERRFTALCLAKSSRPIRSGGILHIDTVELKVIESIGDLHRIRFSDPVESCIEEYGHVPLPPYIGRDATFEDEERYQTVYAENEGAVAAPTAGLHFDRTLLERIQQDGVELARITLHVGSGTFQPLREESLNNVDMHSERYVIPPDARASLDRCKGRVVAVGTTVVRTLETAALTGNDSGETRLFIQPGFNFQVVDRLITNFHLPESTLIMLVCAFAGYDRTMAAYREAVAQRYRFFSYGDALFSERNEV